MKKINGNGRRILVVDDDLAIRVLLDAVLKRMGFSVMLAQDGATALDYLERYDYDLILLDLMMPNVNGFEVLDKLDPRDQTPVVLFTAAPNGDQVRNPKVCAAIQKPFDLDTFLERISGCLSQSESLEAPR
ncbi:MAG: response regulator [Thermoanaerobaculia bacterium]|nr:response regulator [Thermoanaerobaculia bacterium]